MVHKSGENRTRTYTVERTADGAIRRTVVNGAGQKTETLVGNDGVITVKHPDGTIATQESGPDPRFGMQAPIVQRMTVTTPGGTRTTMEGSRSVELTNPVDMLSLKSLTETATVNGKTKTTRYDAAARRFTTSSSLGRTATSEVDLLGRPLRTDAADVAPTLNTYDARGRLKSSTQGTRSTTLTYDTRGRIASVTDGLQRATEYTYDLADRVATIKHPDGRLVAFTYDAAGNRLSVTPPGKGAHTFAYTSRGSVDRYAPPSLLGGTKSTPTTYTADKDGLITGVNQPGGQSIAFAYDTVGRLATVTQPTGTTRHEYDSATGQMTSAVAPGGERASYEYDGALPTKLTLAGSAAGTITIGYDNNLRPATETVAGTAAVSLLYDDDGLVTRVGGLNLDRDPDSGRVQSMTVGGTATTLARSTSGRRRPSPPSTARPRSTARPTGTTTAAGSRADQQARGTTSERYEYTFDSADRLYQVRRDGELRATYNYDTNGNRTQVVRAGELPVTATYDEQDRLTALRRHDLHVHGRGRARDQDGRVRHHELRLRRARRAHHASRCPAASCSSTRSMPTGAASRSSATAWSSAGFLYQGGLSPVAELDADGAVRSRFVYIPGSNVPDDDGARRQDLPHRHRPAGQPAGGRRHGQRRDRAADRLRRVRARDVGHGARASSRSASPAGCYDRDTGLVRFGARDYDPETGRFTARTRSASSAATRTSTAYALADPVNLTDPSGLILDTILDVGFLIYDAYQIGKDLLNGCGLSGVNAAAFGADLAAIFIPGVTGAGPAVRGIAAAGKGLDALSDAGRAAAKGGRTRAGREYQKHMDRGELPKVPGKNLTTPGRTCSTTSSPTRGRAKCP